MEALEGQFIKLSRERTVVLTLALKSLTTNNALLRAQQPKANAAPNDTYVPTHPTQGAHTSRDGRSLFWSAATPVEVKSSLLGLISVSLAYRAWRKHVKSGLILRIKARAKWFCIIKKNWQSSGSSRVRSRLRNLIGHSSVKALPVGVFKLKSPESSK